MGVINWGLIYSELPNLSGGALYTICVSLCSVAIGIVFGLANSILRLSSRKWLYYPATIYAEAFRNTPMLVQILLFYYGLFPALGLDRFPPWIVESFRLEDDVVPAVLIGTIALGLNSGAYLGEIFRGGIQSIDRGQREAALSLGLSRTQAMLYVVLPQALTNALPALGNEFVTMIKDSSLLSVIAVLELTHRADQVGGRKLEYFTMYVGIGCIYFVLCFTLSRVMAILEKRMRVGYK